MTQKKRRWSTLTRERIVDLADEYFAKHGSWPTCNSGAIAETGYESWSGFDQSLMKGRRGLPGGSSLKKLLQEEGRLPTAVPRPKLDIDTILFWADEHRLRTGKWPDTGSGNVFEASYESWASIDQRLRRGQRGLPGGDSLSQLLHRLRGAPPANDNRPLTHDQILIWADAHFERTGRFPNPDSGEVVGAIGEVWSRIETALIYGRRGLHAGGSLAKLLAETGRKRHKDMVPDFDPGRIRTWVLSHFARTGHLPWVKDGAIEESPDDNWAMVDNAFRFGRRGLGGTDYKTLKEFIDANFTDSEYRPRVFRGPALNTESVLLWADAYHNRTGQWPKINSGEIPEAPGETWAKVNHNMDRACRGFTEKTTLARLLEKHRGLQSKFRDKLSLDQILEWADAHYAQTGAWPHPHDRSEIPGAPRETWYLISCSLLQGQRGLPKSSLPLLLLEHRGRVHRRMGPRLTLDKLEEWVNSFRERHNAWPGYNRGGEVEDAPSETWRNIDSAIKKGYRGLAGCGYLSLADFMNRKMGKPISPQRGRWKNDRTPTIARLTTELIIELADTYHATHGRWPSVSCGKIGGGVEDNWAGIDLCLRKGRRGLAGGTSLANLLRKEGRLPPLEIKNDYSIDQILAWADAHYERNRIWPNIGSGDILESPGDTWERLDRTMRTGQRGLPDRTSLSQLLNQKRGVPNNFTRERLSIEKILRWADAHYDRTGQWPNQAAGEVLEAPGESWYLIDHSLMQGNRGLNKGSSLSLLLAAERGKRHVKLLADLDLLQINGWVLGFYARTDRLPRVKDGPIPEAPDESWSIIDSAFKFGRRGLASTGYTSLREFLDSYFSRADFGQRVLHKPKLYVSTILKWADDHRARTGKWPTSKSGDIPDAAGETWGKIAHELYRGLRGINPPTSLAKILEDHRGAPPARRGPLTFEQILKWADEHRARTGEWPNRKVTGEIPGAPFESWNHICEALHQGARGLPKGSSLAMLLLTYRGRPHRRMTPPLDLDKIEEWAQSYLERYKQWPGFHRGGVVDESPNENWRNIDSAFKTGCRGLAGCGYRSLAEFLILRMGKPISPHRGRWMSERPAKTEKVTSADEPETVATR